MTEDKSAILLETAKELLASAGDIDQITTRAISERSGVNLALINYYYGSKDALLKKAVYDLIESSSEDMYGHSSGDPKERIKGFFASISEDMEKYRRFTGIIIPDLLLRDEISLPDRILPMVREHFDGTRSESECRLAAYRMVSEAQLIFYRSEEIGRYVGMDISKDYSKVIDRIVDDILG